MNRCATASAPRSFHEEISMDNRTNRDREREERLLMAAKIGALLCVSVVIAVASLKSPTIDESTVLSSATAATTTDQNAGAKRDAGGDAKTYYYFPSEYELHAGEPGEPVPTF
jgi:hypothetical protein